jgi:hypothetical protein
VLLLVHHRKRERNTQHPARDFADFHDFFSLERRERMMQIAFSDIIAQTGRR